MGNLEELRRALSERYEIVRELGRGGMAIVYLARDTRHDRLVAIKVMRPEVSAQSNFQRFQREIKVAARLQHPHILTVHDSGTAGDALYYVMPFVEGESLRERINRGALPVDVALEIAREVADALDYAHRQGIIHRDIKPENILLTAGSGNTGGHAIVADFGIARAIEVSDDDASATATGIAVGSPAYMSPEQAMGWRDLDARTDIYSLGCLVYEMLTGKPPYGLGSARAAMAGHVSGSPKSITGSGIPPGVQAAIERAMAKEKEGRFASAGEFRDALKVDTGTISLSTARFRAFRRPSLRMAAGVAALLAASATAFVVRPGSSASLKDRAAVVIADVDNATGDPVFRNSLVSALAAGVGQSEHVTLISRARVGETLARMQRTGLDTVLDERVMREAAVREGWGAVVVPSIAVFDSTYVITARLIDPKTGSELATESVRSKGKSGIIDALDELSRKIRRDFGESILSVMRRSSPLPQVTTRSLDALEKYAAGSRAWDNGKMQDARTLYAGAIALDSNFALAQVAMGRVFSWLNDRPSSEKHFERAMANMDRVTDRERMWAAALMANARGDWQLSATGYRAYLSRYPNFATAWLNLGGTLMRDHRPREALAAFAEFMKLDSTSGSAYINMATSYSMLAQYDSAIIVYRKAFALRPDYETWFNVNHEYGMTLAKANRPNEARATFQKMLQRPSPSDQARAHRSMALLELLEGRPTTAISRLKDAIAINASLKEATSEIRNRVFLAYAYEMSGAAGPARAEAEHAAQLLPAARFEPVFSARVATALLRHGRVDQAARLLDSIRTRVTPGNNMERAFMLLVAGEVAQARGNVSDSARAMLREAAVLDSSAEVLSSLASISAAAGDVRGAIETERRLHANQGNVGYEAQFEWNLARYRLGQLHERLGENADARKQYEAFLSEWADAEPNLPVLVDTRARLKRLLALQPKRES